MSRIILEPTATAQWQSLVKEAENSSKLLLNEELESYLVFLLIRFTEQTDLAKSVLALEFLENSRALSQKQKNELRDVGDKCLLISGLFPGRAQRRRVKISYFVDLGQDAYGLLSLHCKQELATLFRALGEGFVSLMDILHVVREISCESERLTPLQADELWQDTASPHALSVLKSYTKAIPVNIKNLDSKKQCH